MNSVWIVVIALASLPVLVAASYLVEALRSVPPTPAALSRAPPLRSGMWRSVE